MHINRETKIRWLLLFLIGFLFFGIAFFFGNSWPELSQNDLLEDFKIQLSGSLVDESFYKEYSDNDLKKAEITIIEDSSDLIIKGKVKNSYKVTDAACYYEIEVMKKYKGEEIPKIIRIYLPQRLMILQHLDYMGFSTIHSFVPLRENSEYILFLEHLEMYEQLDKPEKLKHLYAPVFEGVIGVYDLGIEKTEAFPEEPLYFKELKRTQCVSSPNVEEINIYNTFLEQVKQKYS